MNIALVGASGNVGSRILAELAGRGHTVTAIARHPEKIARQDGVTLRAADAADGDGLAAVLKDHDAVVTALRFAGTDPETLVDTVRKSGVGRLIVVGGASSLEVAPGVRLIDTPEFPAAYKTEASAGVAFLDFLKGVGDLDWTFLSPSALFVPGERTGKFRLGKDTLLTTDKGSSISYEDYAIALVDELETPRHVRERFTVGY